MRNLQIRIILEPLLVILLIGLLGVFYWQTIMYLPLFGDATIHAANARDLLIGGWSAIRADYPPFYYYIMAIFYSFFGEKGYNLVAYCGFLFLLLSTFLLIKYLTKNYFLGLLSMIFVGVSPKIIYYSARMYQEILLSAFFIFTIYLLFRYLEERTNQLLILLLTFIGICLSLKQQGLFVLYASTLLFFAFKFFRKQTRLKELLFIFIVPLIIGLPFYGVLFHTKGELQPGSDEFAVFRILNNIGKKIFMYTPNNKEPSNLQGLNIFVPRVFAQASTPSVNDLDKKLENVETQYSARAYSLAEGRHIWPAEVFLDFDKFNEANSLYLLIWQGKRLESPFLFYFSFTSLILGFLYCLWHYKTYSHLLTFSLFFLPINYLLFSRNTDQQRYHIFLPIFLLSFIFIFWSRVMGKVKIDPNIKVLSIIEFGIIAFIPVLTPRIELNQLWENSQIYSSSIGGIKSVQEAGSWFMENTSKSTIVGQQCGNETHYYSDREVVGDWRIYFLDKKSLDEYFHRNNIAYYVVYQSQVKDDKDWMHVCWVPRSFYRTLEENYKKVYEPNARDIYIYETT